jgi:uncharacterized protein (TIGR02145 family)
MDLNNYVFYWSSTEYNTVGAYALFLYYNDAHFTNGAGDKPQGFSVRCIKN